MLKAEEVTQCYYVTGDHDYILVLSLTDMSHYEQFANKFFFKNPHIKKFNTSVTINKIKFETAIPIDVS